MPAGDASAGSSQTPAKSGSRSKRHKTPKSGRRKHSKSGRSGSGSKSKRDGLTDGQRRVAEHIPSSRTGPLPGPSVKELNKLSEPHVQSFNYFLDEGLASAVELMQPREVQLTEGGEWVRFWVEDATVGIPMKNDNSRDTRTFPSQCRELGTTYAAPLIVTVVRQVGDRQEERFEKNCGQLPIMVRSSRCHLANLSPKELTQAHEEACEFGGYFICNGIERIIRMLQIPRRNHIMATQRSAFAKRGPQYTTKAVSVRCARADQSSITVTLHYLHDGNATLRFSLRKQEFFIPVILVLKALKPTTDREIYERVLQGDRSNTHLADRVELVIRSGHKYALNSQEQVLAYLGGRFRAVLDIPASLSDVEAGRFLFAEYVLVHLDNGIDKYELMVLMLRKLYGFVKGDVAADNPDSPMNQELLLGGHLYTMFVKEKLQEMMLGVETLMKRDVKLKRVPDAYDSNYFKRCLDRQADIGRKAYYLLATGNLVSTSGLDLMQVSGFTVVADKINFLRFVTHFRSVHRGQFFTEMKTTAVRKLLPESWGFMCPVHTPDGSPCGLLNHLAAACRVVTHPTSSRDLPELLAAIGMEPIPTTGTVAPSDFLPVLLDGRVLGSASLESCYRIAVTLRQLKVDLHKAVPESLEVALCPPLTSKKHAHAGKRSRATSVASAAGGEGEGEEEEEEERLIGPFPGLFLATQPARMIRPVKQLASGKVELIGPMEQVFMDIACVAADVRDGVTTHVELSPTSMLSVAASLTPFSDMNQSPRNMYQCQMGKQTMGTPYHTYVHRADNKVYRIQTPQAPIVQTDAQSKYGFDEYAAGTNAVVAVIAYTGYDMEDAMIINKSSYERGFGHGTVYKCHKVDLTEGGKKRGKAITFRFSNFRPEPAGRRGNRMKQQSAKVAPTLDDDGLPPIGLRVEEGDALYSVVDEVTGKVKIGRHKSSEPATVDEVRLLGTDDRSGELLCVSIKLRFNRNPIVGDKFSSRHGQKGVMSILFPQQDMPFTESGMTPDIIINPHAFPSRMTIGMLVESMAAKAGACHGNFQDATPFRFNEKDRAVDHFGKQLRAAGYNYFGSEPLYSGTSGNQLHADIYIGVVYYQRLRHMVSDKAQVRATGPINNLTRQPVKGRKHHGGIRFGEMERDSLLSHGTAFLLNDRLLNCSDRHIALVCKQCGSLLAPATRVATIASTATASAALAANHNHCLACDTGKFVVKMALPYVFRYLVNELAAMNIRVTLNVGTPGMDTGKDVSPLVGDVVEL